MSVTLLVCTTGGHLGQLLELSERLPATDETLWVTHENEQSRSLLADRRVEFVPYVRVRHLGDVLRCVPHARGLLRDHDVVRAVSTGSGIALGYLPYLARRGVACHYVESAARVGGPSLTGRLLGRDPRVRVYSQYEAWARGPWRHGGSVFDGYEPAPDEPPGRAGPVRVVVTVGTAAEFPFRRLVEALAPMLADDGPVARRLGRPLEVLWQTGCAPVDDLPVRATPFLPGAELQRRLDEADLVICHAGTGSAVAALGAGRRPVLVPRAAEHGEVGDDHQPQLAVELERRGLGTHRRLAALSPDDLCAAVGRRVRRAAHPPAFALAEPATGAARVPS